MEDLNIPEFTSGELDKLRVLERQYDSWVRKFIDLPDNEPSPKDKDYWNTFLGIQVLEQSRLLKILSDRLARRETIIG